MLLASILAITSTVMQAVTAQTPQYTKKKFGGGGAYWCLYNPSTDTTPARRFQFIYPPKKYFPTVPSGYIKTIYFRTANRLNNFKFNSPGYAYNIKLSMGWTSKDTFRHLLQSNPSLRDTFLNQLTPVGTLPEVRQNNKDSPSVWMKFPLTGNGFFYDTAKGLNLVVEIVLGPPFIKNYFCLVDSTGGGPFEFLSGYRDTAWVHATFWSPLVGSGQSYDFGFDLIPLGVEASTFSGSFSLYPNPSKGIFHINADALQAIKEAAVTVRAITGQTVFRKLYQPFSSNFSVEINLSDAAKGMYMIEMLADGERVVQRVLVE